MTLQYILIYIASQTQSFGKTAWKSVKGREVDFVVKEGLRITEAIQVCRSLAEEGTRRRELQALEDVRSEIKAKHLTVNTCAEEETIPVSSSNGRGEIKIIPIWKWLLC